MHDDDFAHEHYADIDWTEQARAMSDLISIDGIELSEFDFIDTGEIIEPARVVPVAVKSLLFPAVDPQPGEVLA